MKQRIESVILTKTPKQSSKKKKRILINEDSLKTLWDNNIRIMGIPEEESEQGIENLFEEIMTKNFLNLVKEKNAHVQDAQRVPNKLEPKRPTLRHIVIKMTRLKDNERILKATRGSYLQRSTN